ncbi:hypothetical protein [Spiroplasma endosymbiont of Aspidapion aeneum]|uniref:hypothetical protein n=1 Tax=Spiroplasma endosymbiont of Aspidapion aeneum TaxID=3066276 RepID=UPI00313E17C2
MIFIKFGGKERLKRWKEIKSFNKWFEIAYYIYNFIECMFSLFVMFYVSVVIYTQIFGIEINSRPLIMIFLLSIIIWNTNNIFFAIINKLFEKAKNKLEINENFINQVT